MQNIYGVLPPPPEEHHDVIYKLNTIIQGMQTHKYDLEGLAKANALLTRSKSAVMVQLSQMTVTMNTMQAQLNILSSTTNRTKQGPRASITFVVAGENILMVVKTDQPIKRYIRDILLQAQTERKLKGVQMTVRDLK